MTWTFVMVTPDAMLGGHLGFVRERLAAHGLNVRACRLLGLDYARLGRMYAHADEPATWNGSREALPPFLMTPLYALAPAAVIVLDGTPAAMLACKGATRPENAAGGTVRAAGENYVFNLVHCPDDEESARIELAALVGGADAEGLVATGPGLAPLLGVAQLEACLPAYAGPHALSFPAVANRIRCRAVQRRAARAADARLFDAQRLLDRERAALDAAAGPPERFAIGQAADRELQGLLDGPGLQALSALYDPRGARAVDVIAAMPTYLSAAERLTLDAQAFTHWT